MNKILNIIIYKIYPLIIEISIKIKWFFFKFFFYKYKKNSDCIVAVTSYKKRFPALYFTLLSILLQKLNLEKNDDIWWHCVLRKYKYTIKNFGRKFGVVNWNYSQIGSLYSFNVIAKNNDVVSKKIYSLFDK